MERDYTVNREKWVRETRGRRGEEINGCVVRINEDRSKLKYHFVEKTRFQQRVSSFRKTRCIITGCLFEISFLLISWLKEKC